MKPKPGVLPRKKKEPKGQVKVITEEEAQAKKEEEERAAAEAAERKIEEERIRKEEVEKSRKKYPVAPDGYIPNSVIRQHFNIAIDPPIKVEEPWKLKPVPGANEAKDQIPEEEEEGWSRYGSESLRNKPRERFNREASLRDSMRSNTSKITASREDLDHRSPSQSDTKRDSIVSGHKSAESYDSDDESVYIDNDPDIATQMRRTSIDKPMIFDYADAEHKEDKTGVATVDKEGHGSVKTGKSSKPAKKKEKLKLTKPPPTKVDTEFDPYKRNKKKKIKINMNDPSIMEEDESDIPALIKQITSESWFPQSCPKTVSGVVQGFGAIMDNVDNATHRRICDYIVQVHRDLGYSDDDLDKVIEKLLNHLRNDDPVVRANAAWTLGELGVNRKAVLMGLVPALADSDANVRHEAAEALKKLTGIQDKDGLLKLLQELGMDKLGNSRDDEDAVLAALAAAQSGDENLDDVGQRLQQWLGGVEDGDKDKDLTDSDQTKDGKRSKGQKGKNKKKQVTISDGTNNDDTLTNIRIPGKEGLELGPVPATEDTQASDHSHRKLLPDNPNLYKLYDSQHQQQQQLQQQESRPDSKDGARARSLSQGQGHDQQDNTGLEESGQKSSMLEGQDQLNNKEGGSTLQSALDPGVGTDSDMSACNDFDRTSNAFDDGSSVQSAVRHTDEDSGLGGIMSDDASSLHGKPGPAQSLVNKGMPPLSPVKSTGDLENSQPPENWRDFFDRPSAQERKRQEEAKRDEAEGRNRPVNLPPIQYIGEDIEMRPGDPGVRLLKKVTVQADDSASETSSASVRRRRVNPIPGKLNINTSTEDTGSSKYGILKMQWTTEVPCAPQPAQEGKGCMLVPRPSSQFPELAKLQSIKDTYGDVKSYVEATSQPHPEDDSDADHFLPEISQSQQPQDPDSAALNDDNRSNFSWEKPLPPAPHKHGHACESHNHAHKGHMHYCEYSRLMHKGMHQYTSISRYLQHKEMLAVITDLRVPFSSRGHRPGVSFT